MSSAARFAAQAELVLFFPVFGLEVGFLSRRILNGLPKFATLIEFSHEMTLEGHEVTVSR